MCNENNDDNNNNNYYYYYCQKFPGKTFLLDFKTVLESKHTFVKKGCTTYNHSDTLQS